MISRLFILLFFGIISECYGNAPKLPKAKKLNLKVHINATSDTLVMKFLRPNNNIKLEGFILGYGSNFFSNQYIQWPENGKSYVTEVDAEPRYLIALKPNENSKKSCKEKNSTQKPLQVVVGTLTPTSVFLSWGILINPQFDWSTLNKCPNDRFYTVRYREKNKDWLFQLCPTTETVIDNLKPNTAYEFCVKDNTDDGIWSKPHNHKTTSKGKENGQSQNTYKVSKDHIQVAPEDAKAMIPILVIKQGIQNLTNLYQPKSTSLPSSTEQSPVHKEEAKKPIKTTIPKAPTLKPKSVSKVTELPPVSKTSEESETEDIKPAPYKLQLSSSRPKTSVRPRTRPAQNGTTQGSVRARPTGDVNWMTGTIPGGRSYDNSKLLGVSRNISMEPNSTRKKMFSVSSPPQLPIRPTAMRRRIVPNNVTGRPGSTGSVLVPRAPSTARPNRTPVGEKTQKKQPTLPPEDNTFEDIVFSPGPKVDLDALGKPRYTAPHVKYIPKKDLVPCSITDSLRHFSTEEAVIQEATKAPENPPSNLTVVTVEGCPSFVILDWEQPDNDTVTEYEIISHENGAPPGKEKSIITTNQTFSTVENLQPDKSYEFKIKAKNEHGEGPFSETVEFNTESADPRVSEPVTGGKDAIWTEIKFKSDSYSECKGKQYVKRTWYKKFVGIQLCNSLRYKIYLSDTLSGTFYNIGDQSGYGEDHCQFVDSFLDGRTGQQLSSEQLTTRKGFYRSVRQQPVEFGEIGRQTHTSYVHWYECGIAIPGKW